MTIDEHSTIQPSYVIRKFLDAQKIKNLTMYLATLHRRGSPTPDHTTLLLNCYTKLGDRSKLNEFINAKKGGAQGGKEFSFDVDTAIRVCREANLMEEARTLARQSGKHGIYLDILIEEAKKGNAKKYAEAIDYIKTLPFLTAEKNVKKLGKTLIEHEPHGATELIKLICSDFPQASEERKMKEDEGTCPTLCARVGYCLWHTRRYGWGHVCAET